MDHRPTIWQRRLPIWLVAMLLGMVLLAGFAAGRLSDRPAGACRDTREACESFELFWQAWRLARSSYVDAAAADPQRMTEGAIRGMLESLGDVGHTRFLSAEEAEQWDAAQRGAFEGIGAYIDIRDGQVVVTEPLVGSPAARAGLQPGDLILAVDGASTEGWSAEDLAARVRGPEGTTVTLRVRRPADGGERELVLTRARVVVPSVRWAMLPGDVALIRLSAFSDAAGAELRDALQQVIGQGARAVILDLRNNPGGLVDEMVRAASQFLAHDTPVLIEQGRDGSRKPTETRSGGVALELPLVVLVNRSSASASEILAGALQEAGRATIVGEATFGTGTVLTPYALRGGARLLLGTSQWLTPSGRRIRGQGIVPDVPVDLDSTVAPLDPAEAAALSPSELAASPDTQLVRAIELALAARR